MERAPLVSIITIVYNGEKHIEDTIRSVKRQNYPNLQYIVVDGGSRDNTLAIVERFRDTVTDLISEKDEGISDAFNKGLRLAKGEIVGMINADDWYQDGAIEKAVQAIEGHDVVYGDLQLWKQGRPDFIFRGDHTRLPQEMRINHPTVFVRKSCYDRLGGFDKQYRCAMDYELLLRMLIDGCHFNRVPAVLANMRWDGVSDTRWLLGCRETLAIKDRHLPNRKLSNRLYFYRHVLAIGIPKWLEKLGLGFVMKKYRSG